MRKEFERFRPSYGEGSKLPRLTVETPFGSFAPHLGRDNFTDRVLFDHLGIRIILSADSDMRVLRVKNKHAIEHGNPIPLRDYLQEAGDNARLVAPLPNSFDLGIIGEEAETCVDEARNGRSPEEYFNALYVDSDGKLQMSNTRKRYQRGAFLWNAGEERSLLLAIHGYNYPMGLSPRVFAPLFKSPTNPEAAAGILIATSYAKTLLLRTSQTPATGFAEVITDISLNMQKGLSLKDAAMVIVPFEALMHNFALFNTAKEYKLALYRCSFDSNRAERNDLEYPDFLRNGLEYPDFPHILKGLFPPH